MTNNNDSDIILDTPQKFYVIYKWFIGEVDEKAFNDRNFGGDYIVPSKDNKIKILDLDKRNIQPYALELLNSMNELYIYKMLRWIIWGLIGIAIIWLWLYFKSNWADTVIKAITPQIQTINSGALITDAVPVRHRNITN